MLLTMVDKDKILDGVKYLSWSFPFFFGGPMLLFYSIQHENMLLQILSGVLMLAAMFLGAKGLMTLVEAFFGKRKK